MCVCVCVCVQLVLSGSLSRTHRFSAAVTAGMKNIATWQSSSVLTVLPLTCAQKQTCSTRDPQVTLDSVGQLLSHHSRYSHSSCYPNCQHYCLNKTLQFFRHPCPASTLFLRQSSLPRSSAMVLFVTMRIEDVLSCSWCKSTWRGASSVHITLEDSPISVPSRLPSNRQT